MITLREFAYYDRRKIEDFISIIEGGLSKESKETKREIGKEIEGGVGNFIRGKTGHKEIERQELKVMTDALLFDNFYNSLIDKNMITTIEKFDEKTKQFKTGEIIEVDGIVSLSSFEKIMENVSQFVPMLKILPDNNFRGTGEKDFLIKYLDLWSSKEMTNIKIKPIKNNNEKHIFVASLPKLNITVSSKNELEGQYYILCRIKEILKKNQKFRLFDIIPGINPSEKQLNDALETLHKPSKAFGTAPKIDDLEISHPAIIVTPIAIFR